MIVQTTFHDAEREAGSSANGWIMTPLGKLIGKSGLFKDGDWVESKDQDPDGDVRLIQLADVGVSRFRDRSHRFLTKAKARELGCTTLKVGDILIARMPDPLGRACLFPGDERESVTVVDVAILRPANPEVDDRFLMWAINAPETRAQIEALQKGSTRARISRRNLETVTVPVPPLDEQKEIVAAIETQFARLDDAVAALERARTRLKRYRASVLKAACEGRLVPTEAALAHQNGRPYEPASELLERIRAARTAVAGKRAGRLPSAPTNAESLPPLSEGWAWATLESLLIHLRNGVSKKPAEDGTVPILRISAVRPLKLDWSQVRFLDGKPEDYAGYFVQPEDILFTRYNGNPDLVGVCSTVRSVPRPTAHPDKLILGRFEGVNPHCMAVLLSAGPPRANIKSKVKTTAGQAGISGGDLRTVPVPVPPLAEQERIVAEVERRLSVLDRMEAEVTANLKRAGSLRQAILRRAFSGELT